MARPTKLTPETTKKLCDAIQLGATYAMACKYAGVSYGRFREWIKKGESANRGKFHEFSETIKAAEGKATVQWLAKIEQAANDGAWQAAAWKLERRYPESYGRQVQEHKHSGGVNHTFTIDDLAKARTALSDWQENGENAGADSD